MSASNTRHLRAPLPRRILFDPWNGCTTGHQRADYIAGGSSIEWRDLREAKLQEQFSGRLLNVGRRGICDPVCEGGKDEGSGYLKHDGGIEAHETSKRFQSSPRVIRQQQMRSSVHRARKSNGPELDEAEMQQPNTSKNSNELHAPGSVQGWESARGAEPPRIEILGRKRSRSIEGSRADDHRRARVMTGKNEGHTFHQPRKSARFAPPNPETEESDDDTWDALFLEIANKEAADSVTAAADDDEVWDRSTKSPRDEAETQCALEDGSRNVQMAREQIAQKREKSPPTGQANYTDPETNLSVTSCMPLTQSHVEGKSRNLTTVTKYSYQKFSDVLQKLATPIFVGLTMYISGPTLPLIGDLALRQLLVRHGATIVLHLPRRRVTHVIIGRPSVAEGKNNSGAGGILSARKLDQEMRRLRSATGGPGIRFVRVEWVLECIRTGRRQSEAQFAPKMLLSGDETVLHEKNDEGRNMTVQTREASATTMTSSGPLTHAERENIGAGTVETGLKYQAPKPKATPPLPHARGFQKSLARSCIMPAVPPGVQSVRSLFLKQHRDNAWTKAGFTVRK